MLVSIISEYLLVLPISHPVVKQPYSYSVLMTMCIVYSLDDSSGDTSFRNFDITRSPSYLFSVLKDIMAVNGYVKVHILPWSPVRVISYLS